MIWSRKAFWRQSLLQKLHVLASSRRPGYKIVIERFADLLCPSTKASSLDGLIDSTFDVAFLGCNDLSVILSSVIRPRLSTSLS